MKILDFTPQELTRRIKAQLGVRSSDTDKPSQPNETGEDLSGGTCAGSRKACRETSATHTEAETQAAYTAQVKLAKATVLFWDDVKKYGNESHALRALDCRNREEAITMLSAVQTVSIFKREGRIVIQ